MPAAVSWPVEHLSQAEGCYISFSALNSCHDFDDRKLSLLKPRRNGRFILNSTTDSSNQKRHLLTEPKCLRLTTSNILVCSNSWHWPPCVPWATPRLSRTAAANKERRHAVSVWRKQLIPACAIRGSYVNFRLFRYLRVPENVYKPRQGQKVICLHFFSADRWCAASRCPNSVIAVLSL
jgi:hypothetical protein